MILIVAALVARWTRRRVRRYLQRQEGLTEYVPGMLGRVAGRGVMLVGIVLALTALGLDTSGVVLLLVLLAAILALAGKGILENFAAGILLQKRGPLRTGDRVEIAGYTGIVQEINARSVVIETGDRSTVHVPNADVVDGPIVNFMEKPDADAAARGRFRGRWEGPVGCIGRSGGWRTRPSRIEAHRSHPR